MPCRKLTATSLFIQYFSSNTCNHFYILNQNLFPPALQRFHSSVNDIASSSRFPKFFINFKYFDTNTNIIGTPEGNRKIKKKMLTSPVIQMSMLEYGKFLEAAGTPDCSISNNTCYEKSKCQ